MNRLIKASTKVEVDPEAMEKLLICRTDFMHALENDIKPVSIHLSAIESPNRKEKNIFFRLSVLRKKLLTNS